MFEMLPAWMQITAVIRREHEIAKDFTPVQAAERSLALVAPARRHNGS